MICSAPSFRIEEGELQASMGNRPGSATAAILAPMVGKVTTALMISGLLLAMPMIVKGQNTVLEIDSERNITINGIAAGDSSGIGLTTGDVNNDGVVDVIIGAWLADPDSKSGAGEAYVLFGPLGAGTIELSSDADITLKGVDGSDFSGRGLVVRNL